MKFINLVSLSLVLGLSASLPTHANDLPESLKVQVEFDSDALRKQLNDELFSAQDNKALAAELIQHPGYKGLDSTIITFYEKQEPKKLL